MAPVERRLVLPGIEVLPSGEVTVSAAMGDVLFDLALALGDELRLPVDVQHVLGGIVLADRQQSLASAPPLADTPDWRTRLSPWVRQVFERYDGKLGRDD